jgi:hypothetical protein
MLLLSVSLLVMGLVSEQHGSWSDCADAQAGLDPCWLQTHYVGFVMTRLISRTARREYSWYSGLIVTTCNVAVVQFRIICIRIVYCSSQIPYIVWRYLQVMVSLLHLMTNCIYQNLNSCICPISVKSLLWSACLSHSCYENNMKCTCIQGIGLKLYSDRRHQ